MQIRFTVPFRFYLLGLTDGSLNLYARFRYKGYEISLSLPGGEVEDISQYVKYFKFMRTAIGLHLVLSDPTDRIEVPPLADLLVPNKRIELLRLMRKLAARACRAIRNFGVVPELPERLVVLATEKEVESCLRKWRAEVSQTGESWASLVTEETPYDLVSSFAAMFTAEAQTRDKEFPEDPELKVVYWEEIAEALEENKEPPPESEFVTNAIGHIRQGNFRLAVVESIIALEIVLTQFLRAHLSISAKVPDKRAERFLSPEIGLSARVAALLNITLHESYLQDIDLDKILKVIGWRNDVVHKTGKLPNVSDDILEDHILSVRSLVRMLAERRDNIAASTDLERIRAALRAKHPGAISYPQIWLKARHRVRMSIVVFLGGSKPGEPSPETRLQDLVAESVNLLRERDGRFDGAKHLTIHFRTFDEKSLAWFQHGNLNLERTDDQK
jgi:hypothetical protein